MYVPIWKWRLFQAPGNPCVGGKSHLLSNPNSNKGHFKLIMGLVEWLPPAWDRRTIALHSSIFAHPQHPWIHAALDGSWVIICIKGTSGTMLFSPEVIERCQRVWLGGWWGGSVKADYPAWILPSHFHRSHLAFICSLGSLIINQDQPAFKHFSSQPAPTGHSSAVYLWGWCP